MPFQKVILKPGINVQKTKLLNEGQWSNGNLVRFREGLPEVMGGWILSGPPKLTSNTVAGFSWADNSGGAYAVAGTTNGVYLLGNSSNTLLLNGSGVQQWSLDHWGAYLICNPGGGGLYSWIPPSGSAAVITGAPTQVNSMFISNAAEQIICCGSKPGAGGAFDPMLVVWCDNGNYNTWSPAASNAAGSYPLTDGTYIVRGRRAAQQNLIWTDTALFSMQYIGQPLIYGFNQIATNCGLVGQNACVVVGSVAFWMSFLNFMWYNGTVQPLDCPIRDQIYNKLNKSWISSVQCSVNTQFSEVRWDYPISGPYPDAFVIYNYAENTWTMGSNDASGGVSVGRSAWINDGSGFNPVGFDSSSTGTFGTVWQHENGYTAGGAAMPWFLETSFFDIAEGEEMMFCDLILPDQIMTQGGVSGGSYSLSVAASRYTSDATTVPYGAPFTVAPSTEFINTRIRGRQMSLRFDNTVGSVNTFVRLGAPRLRVAPDGRN